MGFRIILIGLITVMLACSRNPITGKNQINLYSEAEVRAIAADQYNHFLSNHKVLDSATTPDEVQMVNRVGSRISQAIVEYCKSKGLEQPQEYHWEYKLVEYPERNAWYMPGGKLVVYTALLSLTQKEANLAIVLGHLISHDLAKHGNERLSQGLFQQLGGVGLSVATVHQPKETQNLFLNAYGIEPRGSDFLPFTRKQEQEADRLGLILAAMAGYDPKEALPFWEQAKISIMENHQPELLIIHPLDDKRVNSLKVQITQASTFYKTGIAPE